MSYILDYYESQRQTLVFYFIRYVRYLFAQGYWGETFKEERLNK